MKKCSRKIAGLDRTINGIQTEEEFAENGLIVDEEGYVCTIEYEDTSPALSNMEPDDPPPDCEVNAVAALNRRTQSVKNNGFSHFDKAKFPSQGARFNRPYSKGRSFFTRKRPSKFRQGNNLYEVNVIEHYDSEGNYLYEEPEEGVNTMPEISSNMNTVDVSTALQTQDTPHESENRVNTVGANHCEVDEIGIEHLLMDEENWSESDLNYL